MQANERTDEQVAQYLRLDSCLFQTTVDSFLRATANENRTPPLSNHHTTLSHHEKRNASSSSSSSLSSSLSSYPRPSVAVFCPRKSSASRPEFNHVIPQIPASTGGPNGTHDDADADTDADADGDADIDVKTDTDTNDYADADADTNDYADSTSYPSIVINHLNSSTNTPWLKTDGVEDSECERREAGLNASLNDVVENECRWRGMGVNFSTYKAEGGPRGVLHPLDSWSDEKPEVTDTGASSSSSLSSSHCGLDQPRIET